MRFPRIPIFLCLCVCTFAIFIFIKNILSGYEHIPEDKIHDELYKATTPNLPNSTKKRCEYDAILKSSIHLEPNEVDRLNFSFSGISYGSHIPEHCNPTFSVAILVTYRDRETQLNLFLPYMHNFLRKQNIHYMIYLIEQRDSKPWNKGLLYNIGAKRAIADKFPCLILHDVDLLPLDESNLYVCTRQPRHMSACVDKFNYKLPYNYLVGGVLAVRSDQFVAVNGFSNRFRDWGGEDDDFARRMAAQGLGILRFPYSMSRYTMLRHKPQIINPDRFRILEENKRLSEDGLGILRYTSVDVLYTEKLTWIRVVT